MLFGLFGCNPYALIKYPAFSETGSRSVKDFKQLENAKAFIITFWCKKDFFHIYTPFSVFNRKMAILPHITGTAAVLNLIYTKAFLI